MISYINICYEHLIRILKEIQLSESRNVLLESVINLGYTRGGLSICW